MLGKVLDIVIGLVFIYLLYSLLATSLLEGISTILHRRANTLFDGIKSMLTNTKESEGPVVDFLKYLKDSFLNFFRGIGKLLKANKNDQLHNKFYQHPIIKKYGQNLLFKKPSYLS